MKLSYLLPLFGVFLFIFILLNINVGQTLQILSAANPWLILLAASISIVSVVIKSLKWKTIIGFYGQYSLTSCIKSWFIGFSLSMVTPAKIGDFSRAYHLKNRIGLGKGMITVIVDRLADITILFCLAIISFLSFASLLSGQLNMLLTISALFLLFIGAVFLSTKKALTKFFLRPMFYRLVPKKYKSEMSAIFDDFYRNIGSVKSRKMVYVTLLGILAWLVTILQYYVLAMAINLDVPYLFLLLVMPVVVLLDMVPVSFSGIGTRDGALILFFSFVSIGKEYAISFSILVFLFSYALIGLIGSALILKGGRNIRLSRD